MHTTRRTALFSGLAALASAPAFAQTPPPLTSLAGYRVWSAPRSRTLPLAAQVVTETGAKSLRTWLAHRPAVLVLWATWCAPCLVEKPPQARLQARLTAAGSRTRILALQAYDEAPITDARDRLESLNAANLPLARASADAETAFRTFFGASDVDPRRTSLPALVLVDSNGAALGSAIGALQDPVTEESYWTSASTFAFMQRLSQL